MSTNSIKRVPFSDITSRQLNDENIINFNKNSSYKLNNNIKSTSNDSEKSTLSLKKSLQASKNIILRQQELLDKQEKKLIFTTWLFYTKMSKLSKASSTSTNFSTPKKRSISFCDSVSESPSNYSKITPTSEEKSNQLPVTSLSNIFSKISINKSHNTPTQASSESTTTPSASNFVPTTKSPSISISTSTPNTKESDISPSNLFTSPKPTITLADAPSHEEFHQAILAAKASSSLTYFNDRYKRLSNKYNNNTTETIKNQLKIYSTDNKKLELELFNNKINENIDNNDEYDKKNENLIKNDENSKENLLKMKNLIENYHYTKSNMNFPLNSLGEQNNYLDSSTTLIPLTSLSPLKNKLDHWKIKYT